MVSDDFRWFQMVSGGFSSFRVLVSTLLYHEDKNMHLELLILKINIATHARPLMEELNALNVYQLNIYQHLLFMHKIKHDNISKSIKTCFKESKNKYNTKASKITFTKPFFRSKSRQFSINFRGPHLWNTFVPENIQNLPYHSYKSKIKTFCIHISQNSRLIFCCIPFTFFLNIFFFFLPLQ